jgi:hypothetical protein
LSRTSRPFNFTYAAAEPDRLQAGMVGAPDVWASARLGLRQLMSRVQLRVLADTFLKFRICGSCLFANSPHRFGVDSNARRQSA